MGGRPKKDKTDEERKKTVNKEVSKGAALGLGRRLYSSLKSLALSPTLSDILIVAEEKEIPAHRIILYSSSTFFKKCLSVDMKENLEGIIKLPESHAVVTALLTYLYTSDYEDDSGEAMTLGEYHIQLYTAALKYDIPGLAKIALRKFEALAHVQWQRLADANIAEDCDSEISEFLKQVKMIYSNTHDSDDKMRATALKFVKEIMQSSLKELESSRTWLNFVVEVPQCALALLATLAKKPEVAAPSTKMLICPNTACKGLIGGPLGNDSRKRCPDCMRVFPTAKWREYR